MNPTARMALALTALGLAAAGAAVADDAPLWTSLPKTKRTGALPSSADLADRARPAVVHVRGSRDVRGGVGPDSEKAGTQVSVGTGFLINAGGYIVTNEHVVRQVDELRVRLYDGRELAACVVGADAPTDIALLRVEATDPLPTLPLGDSDVLRVGEPVMAIGNPFGFNHSVTTGIVSAKERVVDRSTIRASPNQDIYSFFIQTDASINVGNSGGPLIDSQGAVIGVNAAFWTGHPLQPAHGIGFAIPINMAKALLPRLRDAGDLPRSFLGVDAQPIDASLAVAWKLPSTRGALIASVEAGSPAETGGLEPGDIVVSWNAAAVATSEDLKIDAQLTAPGSRVKVGVFRDGKKLERELTMRAAAAGKGPRRQPHGAACGRPKEARDGADGFDIEDVSAAEGARLPGGRGVAVSRVAGTGPASDAGLHPGDILLRVGKARIRTREDLRTALKAAKAGDTLPVLIRREGFDFWTAYTRR